MSDGSDEDENSGAGVEPSEASEHATRNRSQLDMLRAALGRKKHAAHIDAMLELRASGEPVEGRGPTDPGKTE